LAITRNHTSEAEGNTDHISRGVRLVLVAVTVAWLMSFVSCLLFVVKEQKRNPTTNQTSDVVRLPVQRFKGVFLFAFCIIVMASSLIQLAGLYFEKFLVSDMDLLQFFNGLLTQKCRFNCVLIWTIMWLN